MEYGLKPEVIANINCVWRRIRELNRPYCMALVPKEITV